MKYILAILFLFGVLFGTSYVYDDSPSGGADVDLDSLNVVKLVVENATIDTLDATTSHIETIPNSQQIVLNVPTDATATGGETVSFAITLDDTTTVLKGSYVAVAGGGILDGSIVLYYLGGEVHPPTVVNASTYSTQKDDNFLAVTYTATGACAVTIDSDCSIEGFTFTIKDEGRNCGTNAITVTTEGAETIEGDASYILGTGGIGDDGSAITLKYIGTNWSVH